MSAKDDEIIRQALDNYDAADTAMREILDDAKLDIEFAAGDQWDEVTLKDRKGRPSLTINKLQNIINQVANDQRQNRPSVTARPVDSNIDKDTAKIINGMLRHIQYQSDSEVSFDTACDHAITCGLGYVRVRTDYIDDQSFDQEIIIDRVENPLNVRFPVHLCRKADWSDAPYAFVTYEMNRKDFERKYPDATPKDWEIRNAFSTWLTNDTVTVAEYWNVETATKPLSVTDPATGEKKTRDVESRKVMWYLITAGEVLDEAEWLSKSIPLVPVLGKEVIVNGRKRYLSLIRFSKDAQRMLNYWKSLETEMIALAPKAPYIGAEGQFKGYESKWQSANTRNTPYLEYVPITLGGNPIGAPQRAQQVQIPNAIVNAINEAKEDIKETTGIFDASIGAKSNETSGRAILARQREGDTGTFHFIDNLTRGMRHVFRICIDIIPKVYDTARTVRILGEDMEETAIVVNSPYIDPETGAEKFYQMSADRYDVVVDVGPSFATKRIEAAESMTQFMQALPQQAPLFADLAARNMDWQGAEEIADRIKADLKAKAPHIFAEEEQAQGGGQQGMGEEEIRQIIGDLQALQQQLAQKDQESQQLQEVIGKMEQELENKEADRRVEIEKELIKSRTEIEKTRIQTAPKALDSITTSAQAIYSTPGDQYTVAGSPAPAQNAETPQMGDE